MVPVDRRRVALHAPEKLMKNAFVESFNGRFRDECLNDTLPDTVRGPQRHHLMEAGFQPSQTTLGPRQRAAGRVRKEIHNGKTGRLRQERNPGLSLKPDEIGVSGNVLH